MEAAIGARQQPGTVVQALEDRMTRASRQQREAHPAQQAPVELQSIVDDIDTHAGNREKPEDPQRLDEVRKMLHMEKPLLGHNQVTYGDGISAGAVGPTGNQ